MSVPQWKQLGWNLIGKRMFRSSMHIAHRYRRAILRFFGASIHPKAKIRKTALITCPWNLKMDELAIIGDHAMLDSSAPITLGARSVVSQLAVLTTKMRDIHQSDHAQINEPIHVEDDAWVAADCLVLPGSIISKGTVVGARGLIESSKTEPWHICVGHPARAIKDRPYFSRSNEEGANP